MVIDHHLHAVHLWAVLGEPHTIHQVCQGACLTLGRGLLPDQVKHAGLHRGGFVSALSEQLGSLRAMFAEARQEHSSVRLLVKVVQAVVVARLVGPPVRSSAPPRPRSSSTGEP